MHEESEDGAEGVDREGELDVLSYGTDDESDELKATRLS